MPRTLFVSFTATMYGMSRGEVSEESLASGLFAFGCTHEHVFSPGENDDYVEDVIRERPDLHEQLKEHLLVAEAEGRIVWRTRFDRNMSYEKISGLLVANDIGPIEFEDWRPINGAYCYPGVADRVREKGYDLLVYRG